MTCVFNHDVFIIHAEADERFVRDYLFLELNLAPERAFLLGELELGQVIVEEIQRRVRTSRVTIVVLSPAYLADRWALFGEQLAAYARVARDDGRLLLPLLRADCDVPDEIGMLVGLDFRESQKETWNGQVARLRALLGYPASTEPASLRPDLCSDGLPFTKCWDVFIVHASEDKETVALPLARLLSEQGVRVWLDIHELTLGDSLRMKIDEGLSRSKWGVIILSMSFFQKPWPQAELDALVSRELVGERILLPVWHDISAAEITSKAPLLAARLGISTAQGLPTVCSAILSAMDHRRQATGGPTTEVRTFQDAWFRSFSGGGSQPSYFGNRQLGPFLIQRLIGRGGSGVVFRAMHIHLRKMVVLKVLYPLDDQSSIVTKASERGLRALACLQHPNVLSPLDFGCLRNNQLVSLFIVTEFITGKNLETWTHEICEQKDALNKRVHVAIQLTQGILAAHECRFIGDFGFEEQGILHGDIKPDNILIEHHSERPLIIDFMIPDIQRLLGNLENVWWRRSLDCNIGHNDMLTSSFGTPHFMAPEQEKDGLVLKTSDIYSLGITFTKLFWPLQGKIADCYPSTRAYRQMKSAIEAHGKCEKDLKQLVLAMITPEARDRPQQMSQVLDVLEKSKSYLEDARPVAHKRDESDLVATNQTYLGDAHPVVHRHDKSLWARIRRRWGR